MMFQWHYSSKPARMKDVDEPEHSRQF